ncbi:MULTISPECIES: SMC-Scp complex subunit ScpB [Terrabacteria group]|uniref:SMC-Scp complex subunit ScpB n=1 Tax=Bacillati TaxID=1783272 RepID=UPI001C6F2AB2|nr:MULTISPECIES: SMC-Scp complex subunit ScpB [Terrabacteria group]MBW9213053.1 SMC-Scp complex subunit ScpB [Trueperella sp. zg.1013]
MENQARLLSLVEGLLFAVGEEGIRDEQLKDILSLNEEQLHTCIEELNQRYEQESSGIELSHYGGRYRLLSKGTIEPYLKTLFQEEAGSKLSVAAMETLAIIAYKQPITRVEIEEIRGVGADVMLRKLQARGLIEEVGRSQAAGRPILYGVSEAFLDAFQLESLQELPDLPDYQTKEEDELFGESHEI